MGWLRAQYQQGSQQLQLLVRAWRRSLQLRVVASTLALSSVVVLILGLVLQTQVTDRLLGAKRQAAIGQTTASVSAVRNELSGAASDTDALQARFASALNKLTSPSTGGDPVDSSAGAFEPALIDSNRFNQVNPASAGPTSDVPTDLRSFVQDGKVTTAITTVSRQSGSVTMLVVGSPVQIPGRSVELYLLFPLTAEQNTLDLIQTTLAIASVVLVALLAAIAFLVTTQVVRPVRQAADVAVRFADGQLNERMPERGEDDVAKLGRSFNDMAASIQQQIRQLEEFGALQRRFTSDVSHELRTPLTTVRMAADVLHGARDEFPSGLQRSAELLVDELDRFEALLADLLEISRLDAGVAELETESAELTEVVAPAVDSLRAIADAAGSRIDLVVPDSEVRVPIEPRRVSRIVRNLVANAIDHGEGHPVVVRIAGGPAAAAVTVRDFGVGLDPGEAELVFNRFWRADASRNRRTGGTGLGLSISLEDARLHGGALEAWGAPGKGTCFRLTLPKHQPDEADSGSEPAAPTDIVANPLDRQAQQIAELTARSPLPLPPEQDEQLGGAAAASNTLQPEDAPVPEDEAGTDTVDDAVEEVR